MTARREFLMLAKPSKGNEQIGGWYLSEKLDGMRCFWDGGVSRGHTIDIVPWANLGKGEDEVATGLWSRYGNPIQAPDWFLNELPCCPLDGELYCGRGEFQTVMSTCRKKTPVDAEWKKVKFQVFSSPSLDQVFRTGEIKNPNFNHVIFKDLCHEFLSVYSYAHYAHITTSSGAGAPFDYELQMLEPWLEGANEQVVSLLSQLRLPEDNDHAWEVANQKAKNIVEAGGEGCILRCNKSPWVPKRVGYVLKMKPSSDAEAVVIGGHSGKTGKTGKLHGLMGNLVVLFTHEDGTKVEFELSGFTDDEREILCLDLKTWALDNPGKKFPNNLFQPGTLKHFNPGDTITFTYREFSKAGVPKDARYLRKRPTE